MGLISLTPSDGDLHQAGSAIQRAEALGLYISESQQR